MPSKKLGALLQSVPPATARQVADISPVVSVAEAQPARRRAVPAITPAVVKEEPEVPLQVLVPAHIREQLGIMAAKERGSLRSLILRGVQRLGIEVTEDEIKGKRGRRRPT